MVEISNRGSQGENALRLGLVFGPLQPFESVIVSAVEPVAPDMLVGTLGYSQKGPLKLRV